MQIVKTLLWVLLAVFVAIFVMLNYGEPQRVKIWLSEDPIGFDWPVGIIALVFWLLGVIPTWLYHRGIKWSLGRRIRSLENSIKSNALVQRRASDETVPVAATPATAPAPTPAPSPAPTAAAPVDKPVEKPAESLPTSGAEPDDKLTPTSDKSA